MLSVTLNHFDTSELEKEIMPSGKLIPKPYDFFCCYSHAELLYFMTKNALYMLPTIELLACIKEKIIGSAIEIGAGNGSLGRALGIPITDSMLQSNPEIKIAYALMGQPVIEYPDDVEKLDAIEAINKYKPDTIVGSFVTWKWKNAQYEGNYYAPDEQEMIKMVKRYIMVGNLVTHKNHSLVREHKTEVIEAPWIITRGVDNSKSRIFIWDNEKI